MNVWSYEGDLGEFFTSRWKSEHGTVKTTTVHAQPLQSSSALCDPVDCSPPGSSVHGLSQARILEWASHFLLQGISPPRDGTQAFCIAVRFFTIWATRKTPTARHGSLPENRLQSLCGWWQGLNQSMPSSYLYLPLNNHLLLILTFSWQARITFFVSHFPLKVYSFPILAKTTHIILECHMLKALF